MLGGGDFAATADSLGSEGRVAQSRSCVSSDGARGVEGKELSSPSFSQQACVTHVSEQGACAWGTWLFTVLLPGGFGDCKNLFKTVG